MSTLYHKHDTELLKEILIEEELSVYRLKKIIRIIMARSLWAAWEDWIVNGDKKK